MNKKALIILFGIIIFFVSMYLSGPRANIDTTLQPVTIPENIDDYISKKESYFTDIIPGTESRIVWADSTKSKTEYSIVYLHGFSGTNRETVPMSDSLAAIINANLYYPRLTGHGRTGIALSEASVNDWLNDTYEALLIGKRLGEKTILIGNSAGTILAVWIASQSEGKDISAIILMSPGFGLKNKMSNLLLTPWARYTIPLLVGKNSDFKPINPDHKKYWTSTYPTVSLLSLMGLIKLFREIKPFKTTIPVMVIYSPNDKVIDVNVVERFYRQLPTDRKHQMLVSNVGNEECHVIVGDILSPETTMPVVHEIVDFIHKFQ